MYKYNNIYHAATIIYSLAVPTFFYISTYFYTKNFFPYKPNMMLGKYVKKIFTDFYSLNAFG